MAVRLIPDKKPKRLNAELLFVDFETIEEGGNSSLAGDVNLIPVFMTGMMRVEGTDYSVRLKGGQASFTPSAPFKLGKNSAYVSKTLQKTETHTEERQVQNNASQTDASAQKSTLKASGTAGGGIAGIFNGSASGESQGNDETSLAKTEGSSGSYKITKQVTRVIYEISATPDNATLRGFKYTIQSDAPLVNFTLCDKEGTGAGLVIAWPEGGPDSMVLETVLSIAPPDVMVFKEGQDAALPFDTERNRGVFEQLFIAHKLQGELLHRKDKIARDSPATRPPGLLTHSPGLPEACPQAAIADQEPA